MPSAQSINLPDLSDLDLIGDRREELLENQQALIDSGALALPGTPGILNTTERQQAIAQLTAVGASQEEIDVIRFAPLTFDPVLPTSCAGSIGGILPGPNFDQIAVNQEPPNNLDFSCIRPQQKSGVYAIGEDFQDAFDSIGAETQRALDRSEAEINRTDENLANIRDEARSGLRSVFSDITDILPGGRIIKFAFFAVIAIVVLIILRLLFGLFRG